MTCKLLPDCLNDIFEFLEDDKKSLYSCLLVNRLWCEISVRILWKNIWDLQYNSIKSIKILSTLIAFLPNESRELLYKNGIFIPTPTTKTPLFDYVSFCKFISIGKINLMIEYFQEISVNDNNNDNNDDDDDDDNDDDNNNNNKKNNIINYDNGNDNKKLITREIIKIENCLSNLSELCCNSNIHSEFFYQISQICHNIQSITVEFKEMVSNELNDLIISQNNLKSISLIQSQLIIIFDYQNATLNDFKDELRYFHFQHLKILKFEFGCPKYEVLIDFIKINGKNLSFLHINRYHNLLNLVIPKFCPNLRSLCTILIEKETLISILNGCQHLESIQVMCGHLYIKEEDMFEVISEFSPKSFHELRLYNYAKSHISSKDLDSFFISWTKRIPQKSITFICLNVFDDLEKKNMKVIEKYKKLRVIKNAKIYL
ncbi:hypothetical protein C1645_873159 [Glomus cerebriforme]|uniref:F-box domain-containing protein n=1 Tax=Glomus cerebriforme TaxID=658196 RepID=A0A397T9L7_9GLOM|nr:hypothetical protein C1645_873159 [Glomus cerebriforme]